MVCYGAVAPSALGFGRSVLAEVEELVAVGEIDPEVVVTPSIFVDYVFQGTDYEKRIEQRTTRS